MALSDMNTLHYVLATVLTNK